MPESRSNEDQCRRDAYEVYERIKNRPPSFVPQPGKQAGSPKEMMVIAIRITRSEIGKEELGFYRNLADNIQEISEKQPWVVNRAVEEFHYEAKKSLHYADPLEHLIKRVAGRKVSPKKRGAKRKGALRLRVKELRESGKSWAQIQRILNSETGADNTSGAYRNLFKRS